MARINKFGYLERKTSGRNRGKGFGKTIYRNWWLVKWFDTRNQGIISFSQIYLPPQYIGKRVRFKIEVIKEKEANK